MKRLCIFFIVFLLAGICSVTAQEDIKVTAINPDKFIFGVNVNAAGFMEILNYYTPNPNSDFYVYFPGSLGVNIELGKGNFNSEIKLFLTLGTADIGGLVTFNYFWHSRIGGAYLGGGIGYSFSIWSFDRDMLPVGINGGYKFVTKPGVYFRTGVFFAFDFLWRENFYIQPDLAIGWTMR